MIEASDTTGMQEAYREKARLIFDVSDIAQFRTLLEAEKVGSAKAHWAKVSPRVMTLFQVLMDRDLTELVAVLELYPEYIELICEHFRYAYSYNEQTADTQAASRLLFITEHAHSKQFVRNLLRKLTKMSEMDMKGLDRYVQKLKEAEGLHPIILDFYYKELEYRLEELGIHKLQRAVLLKKGAFLKSDVAYDFAAEDRDSNLDIPYMH